jgi:hypothetical protein
MQPPDSCNVTFWRVRIPIFAVENVTVRHLCSFEQQCVTFVPLASFKMYRTAASVALLDTILQHCLLGEAFPLLST